MNLIKRSFGIGVALTLSAGIANAAPADPTGFWEAENGESRYELKLCGDGTQLCGKLIWIRPDVINDRNKQYIGSDMLNGAKRRNDREWAGKLNIYGTEFNGVVRQSSPDVIRVRACAFVILCEGTYIVRIDEASAAE